jgi:hypothetical protein
MVVFPHFLSVPNPICALTLCARALSHRCDREELFFCAMFCFPTNVEARCWCVVVIIFLHNGSKRVIKGNKSRSREKYVKVRGVRFLRASVFIMRVGRFHARVSTLLVLFWSFLFTPTKTTTRDETRAYLDLLFHLHSNPPIFPPPKKKGFCV